MPTPGTSTIAGSAPRIGGESARRVLVVVRGVVVAVGGVQLAQPGDDVRRAARSAAGRAPAAAPWCAGSDRGRTCRARPAADARRAARKSSTASQSVKWPTCGRSVEARPRITGASAAARACRSASGSGVVARQRAPNGSGRAVLGDELLGGADDLERVRLALLARLAPRGDAVPAEDAADRLRVRRGDRGDVEARAGSRDAATAPRRRGRRSTRRSAARRRPTSPARCPSPGAGGRRAARSTRPCIAVSIDGAAPPLPCRQ